MTNKDTQLDFQYRGERNDLLRNNKNTIEAKITDWYCSNEIRSNLGGESSSEEDPDSKRFKSFDREYVIRIFFLRQNEEQVLVLTYSIILHTSLFKSQSL